MAAAYQRRGSEFLVNTTTLNDQFPGSVIALASGAFVIVWTDASRQGGDASGTSVKAQMFDASGIKIGGEFLVNTTVLGDQGPGLEFKGAALSSGGFVVTWRDHSGLGGDSDTSVKAQIFDASGNKVGSEFLVNSTTLNSQTDPNVASLSNGGFVVAWTDFSGQGADASGPGIKAQRFDASGNKVGGEFLVNTVTLNGQSSPSITSLASGGFLVTWSDDSNFNVSSADVKGQIFDAAGNKVGGEFLVNTTTQDNQQISEVAGLASGGFVVTWINYLNQPGGDVAAQIFDSAGNKVGGEILVNTTTVGSQLNTTVTALPSGGFAISWSDFSIDNDGSGSSVRSQIFDSAGNKVGAEFIVNTTTAGFQTSPRLTTLASGELVVAWSDDSGQGGDASGRSVKAQIFREMDQNFTGTSGDDDITGGSGSDRFLLQQGGDDTVEGLAGVDSFFFGAEFTPSDVVDGGDGFDVLSLQGDYSAGLTFGTGTTSNITGIDSVSLFSGSNTLFGDTAGNSYSYDLTTLDANVAAGEVLRINGANLQAGEDLTFDGSAETDGSFLIYGSQGIDTITAGQGGDSFVFPHLGHFGAGDSVDGGDGYDVVYLRGDYTIDFNAPGFAGSISSVESIGLLSATEKLYAGGGDGEFDYALVWNDAMLADTGTLVVNGSRLMANETMDFDGSQEVGGSFRLFGGTGADVLRGGGGDDLIFGNLGADTLQGGGGADVFRYISAEDSTVNGRDAIQDFSIEDIIDLSRMDANGNTAENDAFDFIGDAQFTGQAGQLRAVQTTGPIWTVSGDTDGDGNADFEVVVVVTDQNQPLTGSDFIL